MSAVALLGDTARDDVWRGAIIDTDVHAVVPSIEALFPYLDPVWRQFVADREWAGPVPARTYPPALPSTARPEWRPGDGRVPAGELSLLQAHVLDPWAVEHAILSCYYPVDSGSPDASSALASAVNDWLIAEWLDRDARLRGSIVLPGGDPAAMVREIDRVGAHPGFVQVQLPVRSGRRYGNRLFHPVFDAIVRHDLVAGLHWGGSNDLSPPTPSGWPSWFVEEYVAEQQVYEAQVASLVVEGLFQLFPALRVSVLEIGFAWLPAWMWRMDKDWKGMRREIPWVDRPPSALIREHMRFTTAPLDAGPPDELARVVGWLGSDELLMFASDYPHMHDDELAVLLGAIPVSMRARTMSESAREWYRL